MSNVPSAPIFWAGDFCCIRECGFRRGYGGKEQTRGAAPTGVIWVRRAAKEGCENKDDLVETGIHGGQPVRSLLEEGEDEAFGLVQGVFVAWFPAFGLA